MKYLTLIVLFLCLCHLFWNVNAKKHRKNSNTVKSKDGQNGSNNVNLATHQNTTTALLPSDGISHIVDLILESGNGEYNDGYDDKDNFPTTSTFNTVSSYEDILKLEEKENSMDFETNTPYAPPRQRRRCNSILIEYRILSLISSNRLPFNAVFPKWNKKESQREKIKFLNKTLIKHNLHPLPNCKQQLKLRLSLRKLNYFYEIQSTISTSKSTTPIEGGICDSEQIDMMVVDHVRKEQLLPATVLQIEKMNLNLQEKVKMLNNELTNANLPLLPQCSLSTPATKGHTKTSSTSAPSTNSQQSHDEEDLLAYRKKVEEKITALIQQGFLPKDTLEKLQRGEIDEEWIRMNVTKNRDFVMSQLPSKIQDLITAGKMPEYIEEAIFSGSLNASEIFKIIFDNDEVVKMLLPKKVTDMLEDRPVPDKLKMIMMSGKNETEMANDIKNDTDLLEEIMSPSMFFFYTLFQVQRNRDINTALSVVLIVVLIFIMIALGCTMTLQQIGEHARRPKGVIIALFAQFLMMPAAAFGLTRAFNLDVFSSMAVLICGCCPGGNLSNMLAYAFSGDMNLSILMTTCSSIVGLGMMPLNIFLYSKFIVSVDSGQIVPFDKIVLNIALTIIPVGVGIGIRRYKPQWVPWTMRFGGISLVVGTILVAVLSGVMFGDAFFIYFPASVLGCCAILPLSGYIFGYFFAWIARENPKCRRTICVETGCQNVQLCSTVLKLAFDPILVGVLFLMPLVYMSFQIAEAVLLISGFKFYNRCKGKKVVDDEDSEEKKKSDVESNEEKKKELDNDEEENLLNAEQDKAENGTDSKQDDKEKNVEWPLDSKPTESYIESLKTAGSEHLF